MPKTLYNTPLVLGVTIVAAVFGAVSAPVMLYAGGLLDGDLTVVAAVVLAMAAAGAVTFATAHSERVALFTLLAFMAFPSQVSLALILVAA